jgi:methylthioribulose-1-phosphate dehydratase
MPHDDPHSDRIAAVIRAGELFHQRGWVPATSGNLSFAIDDDIVAITRSGCHKGELAPHDFVVVDRFGVPSDPDARCSAETLLHCQVYRRFSWVTSVMHTHSKAAVVLSRRRAQVVLEDYELLKALRNVVTHAERVVVPVFDNDQDVGRLAGVVDECMAGGGARHGYLIRGHGLYTWGETLEAARYRVEALECLLECELAGEHA